MVVVVVVDIHMPILTGNEAAAAPITSTTGLGAGLVTPVSRSNREEKVPDVDLSPDNSVLVSLNHVSHDSVHME